MTVDTSAPTLDDLGRRIVAELQADGRLSLAELGRRVSLSPPAVAERLRRLEEAGVITGYTARVDPGAVGYGLMAFVRLSPQQPGDLYERKVHSFLHERREVIEAHHITGEDCYLIKVRVKDARALGRLLRERIGGVPSVRSTRSTVVLETLREGGGLPLGELDASPLKEEAEAEEEVAFG